MTSNHRHDEAYVWIWLPGETKPIVAGRLSRQNDGRLAYNYGRSYLSRENAIAIYAPELPLKAGSIEISDNMQMPSCIRDGSPDAWGRRVIINRMLGLQGKEADAAELDELTYMLESGSDRIGALDFQKSPNEYVPRQSQNATLEELIESAKRVEDGVPLSPELDLALQHGTALGGARPKALIDDGDRGGSVRLNSFEPFLRWIFRLVRGGSVRLNSFEPFLRWIFRLVMPPPGLVAT